MAAIDRDRSWTAVATDSSVGIGVGAVEAGGEMVVGGPETVEGDGGGGWLVNGGSMDIADTRLIGFLFLPGIYRCTAGGWRGTGREGRQDSVFTAWGNIPTQVPASHREDG
jgi:hypothetical protein